MNIIELKTNVDNRGALTVIEGSGIDIPFDIKRCYILHNLSEARGGHAHPLTQQIVICVNGWANIKLHDGVEGRDFILNKPTIGLLINPMTWIDITSFSEGANIMVLASTHYEHKLTIRDMQQFLNLKLKSL
jgi:dTDP-4-dehydrorhamnose 3,5-epimerase-like enzyme